MHKFHLSAKGMRSSLITYLDGLRTKVYAGKIERVERLISYALSQVPIQEEATIQVLRSGARWTVKVLASSVNIPTLIVTERTDGRGFLVNLPNKALSHKPKSMPSPYHPPRVNSRSLISIDHNGQ